jgi:hypothetical protein
VPIVADETEDEVEELGLRLLRDAAGDRSQCHSVSGHRRFDQDLAWRHHVVDQINPFRSLRQCHEVGSEVLC